MVVPMRSHPTSPASPSGRASGFTLVEALAALAIFAVAVLVATAFLQAHVTASRRLEVRTALLRASETVLEEIRGGRRPMVPLNLERKNAFGLTGGATLRTSVRVESGGAADLTHVVVTSRSTAAGAPMAVTLESMVWRP